MTLAFIVCVEQGNLENQAKLLCRTIRRYAGRYRTAPIYTFQPRWGTDISRETQRVLDELGVLHSTETLNTEFHDYPYGNKIFVCARAEEMLTEEILVFLDSDTIFTGEPADLDLPEGIVAAVRPADSIVNSIGPGDPNDAYWQEVYTLFGLQTEPYVHTELGRWVRAYFSSGLVAVRRSAGLFRQWKSDFLRLVRGEHMPQIGGIRRMDEISLVTTLVRMFDRVRLLDSRHNYLIEKRSRLGSPWCEMQLEELIHVHYRRWFNKPGFLRLLRPTLDPASEIVQWLEQYLPFDPIIDKPMPFERGGWNDG